MSESHFNSAENRPDGKTCDVSECNAWRCGELRFCYHHKGMASNGTPEEGNQRAMKHGLFSVPEYLKEHFTEEQEDRYTAYFEALCSRYERLHSEKPDDIIKDRLSRIAIECVKERIADEYLADQAEGNILVERGLLDTNEGVIEVEQENKILKELTALKRETRLTLKDMGLLRDPESQKADAMGDITELWAEDLE